jgi:hypothetical protein
VCQEKAIVSVADRQLVRSFMAGQLAPNIRHVLAGKGTRSFCCCAMPPGTHTHITIIITEQATIRAFVITSSIATFCLLHSMNTRFVDKQSTDHRIPIRIETVSSLSLHA